MFAEDSLSGLVDSDLIRQLDRLQLEAGDLSKQPLLHSNDKSYLDIVANLNLVSHRAALNQSSLQADDFGRFTNFLDPAVREFANRWLNAWLELRNKSRQTNPSMAINTPVRFYIPALRTVRRQIDQQDNDSESKDRYPLMKSIIAEYFRKIDEKIRLVNIESTFERCIFDGVQLHDIVHDLRLGDLDQRQLLESFEKQISEHFFEGKRLVLIPKRKSRELHFKLGAEEERPFHGLGEGLQNLIILTFPIFIAGSRNLMMFVEEPELYMHPGLQRDLIEAWLNPNFGPEGKRKRQIFIATHSSQFIDLTLDLSEISVFGLTKVLPEEPGNKKTGKVHVRLLSSPDKSVLADLGIRNSSLLLSNATIWVEGITDRMYIRKFLELVQRDDPNRIREDVHFSFVEYGGANVVHWSVLDRDEPCPPINVEPLCGRLMLIADNDGGRHGNRLEEIRKVLGDRLIELPCREIENLLSPVIIQKTVGDMRKGASFSGDISQNDYRSELLGTWIDKMINQGTDAKGKFAGDSGTIKNKRRFAEFACGHMMSLSDLSNDAFELTTTIIEFVRKQNPKR
jgi:hypothetical protein